MAARFGVGAVVRDIWLTAYPDLRRSSSVKVVMDFLVECVQQEPLLRY